MNTALYLIILACLLRHGTDAFAISAFVCEHESQTITCKSNQVLRIDYAFYHRKSTDICPSPSGQAICAGLDILPAVTSTCSGHQSCSIKAKNSRYGDPCTGVSNYVEVRYKCIQQNAIENSAFVCEHDPQIITCKSNQVLQIDYAFYHRTSTDICPSPSGQAICAGLDILPAVTSLCSGHQSCSIKAKNSHYGDPCTGVSNYVEVRYKCIQQNAIAISAFVCEHDPLTIKCKSNQVLQIDYAFYHRKSTDICPSPSGQAICAGLDILPAVTSTCSGRQSCSIKAKNSHYGDPCTGVSNYVEVRYKCIQQTDATGDIED